MERQKKKKRLAAAWEEFNKFQKELDQKCGHFKKIGQWTDFTDRLVNMIDQYVDVVPPTITEPILQISGVSRRSVDAVNKVCKTLNGNLTHILKWIQQEMDKILDNEPTRPQEIKPPPPPPKPPIPKIIPVGGGIGVTIIVIILLLIPPPNDVDNNYPSPEPIRTMTIAAESPINKQSISSDSVTLAVIVRENPPIVGADVAFYLDDNFQGFDFSDKDGYASITIDKISDGEHTWWASAIKDGYEKTVLNKQSFSLTKPSSQLLERAREYIEASNNFDLGKELYEQGNYEDALIYFDKVLEEKPQHFPTLIHKGNSLVYLKEYEDAITQYDKILAIDPNYKLALTNKGNALNHLGSYEEAITYFDQALNIEPLDVYALSIKAYSLQKLGMYEEALSFYDKALQIDPSYAFAAENKLLVQRYLRSIFVDLAWSNERFGNSLTLVANGLPNIVPTAGEPFQIIGDIKNTGNVKSPGFTFYVQIADHNNNLVLAQTGRSGILEAQETKPFALSVTLADAGTYTTKIMIDNTDNVSESNEDNNVATLVFEVKNSEIQNNIVKIGESWSDYTHYEGYSEIYTHWKLVDEQGQPVKGANVKVTLTHIDTGYTEPYEETTNEDGIASFTHFIESYGNYLVEVNEITGTALEFQKTEKASLSITVE